MNWIKALLATAAVGVIVIAFRDSENERWLVPTGRDEADRDAGNYIPDGEEEPVLGYDGMDQEALLDWLVDARLDRSTLARIRRYEAENLGRESVIEAVEDLL